MSISGRAWRRAAGHSPRPPAESDGWEDYWARKGIDEALKQRITLQDTLQGLRHTTYITVGLSIAIHLVFRDLADGWQPSLAPVTVYVLGCLGVLFVALYVHYPVKVGMDIYPDRFLEYTNRSQAKDFVNHIKELVARSQPPLMRRSRAVNVSVWSVSAQVLGICLAWMERISL